VAVLGTSIRGRVGRSPSALQNASMIALSMKGFILSTHCTFMSLLNKHREWYKLDNAARIFPAVVTSRMTTVYRLAVVLCEAVDKPRLQASVEAVAARFPYYQVHLKYGLFWNYFEEQDNLPLVQDERLCPCRVPRRSKDRRLLYRILVYGDRISVEFSHTLTDGSGALSYMQTLLAHYLGTEQWDGLLKPGETPDPEEDEDSYQRYFQQDIPPAEPLSKAFHISGMLLPPATHHITTGVLPVAELKAAAKAKQVSITEWLAAVLLMVLQEAMMTQPRSTWKPIRLMIPVNLRPKYPSATMRNFFLTLLPEVDARLGRYDFDECLKSVYHFMRSMNDPKFINRHLTRNVAQERTPYTRFAPLCCKLPVGRLIYNHLSTGQHSGVLTNLGLVRMPEDVAQAIDRFTFIANPNPITRINTGVIAFGDQVAVTFGSLISEKAIEQRFFAFLRTSGIPVKLETNYRWS
jgi:hypothetical protein